MKVTNREIAQAVLNDLQAGKSSQTVVTSLAAYLVHERRSRDADAIVRDLDRLQCLRGKVELEAVTVSGLSAELKQTITKLFQKDGQDITVHETHDPSVLGGVLVESGEERLDLTLRRQIQRLKGVRV